MGITSPIPRTDGTPTTNRRRPLRVALRLLCLLGPVALIVGGFAYAVVGLEQLGYFDSPWSMIICGAGSIALGGCALNLLVGSPRK